MDAGTDAYDLQRFVDAQNHLDTYGQALRELRNGRKVTHWTWFVFPQIEGLGQSPQARRYAISSLEEARAYLDHPLLGPRLHESSRLIAESQTEDARDILGDIDAQKLRSSMTLFHRAEPDEAVFADVLTRFFDGACDWATDQLTARAGPELN